MPRRFFELDLDIDVPGRWYLREPTDLDGKTVPDIWAFVSGKPITAPGPLRVPLSRPGQTLDFDKTTVAGTPIVSARIASVFRELAPNDVQLFPVDVQGQSEPFSLLNVMRVIRCIDDAACEEARLWTTEDGRPDKVGEYHVVSGLRIDTSRVGDAGVFRPWGYLLPIIVAGHLKEALERTGIVGGRFVEV
ncbi:imm11 family protein [Corallococcus sp. RDP092CA]|uniref:imm11 family protein n=1 Tax=Corallococcus sp. RDP092CA TaxID=3109369 RepID=UPI0035B0D177